MTSKLETRKTMQHYCIMYGHKGKTLPDKRILRFSKTLKQFTYQKHLGTITFYWVK